MSGKSNGAKKPQRLDPTRIQLRVVQVFVTHYCMEFPWAPDVLGKIRARDFAGLLMISKAINTSLIESCSLDETHHTLYGEARSFRLASQFVALVGKYQYDARAIPGLDPEGAAIKDFLDAERRNKRLNSVFRAHLHRGSDRHWCIPLVRDVFCRVLGRSPHYEEIFRQCDFSSGASVAVSGDLTHLAKKLCGDRITGSSEALELFLTAVRGNFHYSAAFSEVRNGIVCVDPLKVEITLRALWDELDYNMVSVVPKNAESGRTIGKEPELHNFLQKGIDLTMRNLLLRVLGIDLSRQEPNQLLAYDGSVGETDPYVTIDVRGASNSVLTELVRSVVPPRWFRLFDKTRSHFYKIDGKLHQYQMFCSMGNGFCFPLETTLFAAICIAAAKHSGVKPDYRTYGDDIIVRQSQALVVIECLQACGFRTNVQKTYVHGPFRESCGANWYGGQDVTPGYLKEPITTVQGLHVLHNALGSYPVVQEYLRSLVKDPHLIPNLPCWSWITDQAFKVGEDMAMTAKWTEFDQSTQSFKYKILLGLPVADDEWQSGKRVTEQLRDHMVLTATLRGSRPEEPFHYRKRTKLKACLTTDVRGDAAIGKLFLRVCRTNPGWITQVADRTSRIFS